MMEWPYLVEGVTTALPNIRVDGGNDRFLRRS